MFLKNGLSINMKDIVEKMEKQEMLNTLKILRKKYGNQSTRVYEMIYQIVKKYPLYPNYEEYWLERNGYKLNNKF
jgi:hypothetical protein